MSQAIEESEFSTFQHFVGTLLSFIQADEHLNLYSPTFDYVCLRFFTRKIWKIVIRQRTVEIITFGL